ncbi:MAG: hypothetical protein JNN05_08490 [Candidatus Omnitrophica bacterium]|nr:hypothetical protein [Candidatus Omnitrophota bacterium]
MTLLAASTIVFKHMIELKSCGCVFCYTQEEGSGRSRIFLVFKDKGRVYFRNGLRGIWDEILDSNEVELVLSAYNKATLEKKVPCFATTVQELAYV